MQGFSGDMASKGAVFLRSMKPIKNNVKIFIENQHLVKMR
jgi:hypothetical protein